MKTISLLLLLWMVVMLTGCPKGLYSTRPSTKLGQDKLVNTVNSFLANRQNAYYCAVNGVTPTFSVSTEASDFGIKYACTGGSANVPTSPQNLALAKRIRNEVLENGITAVDGVYNNFADDLNTGRATTNFVADVIDLGVGAAVGITKGERALQILGVALTAFRGGRKSIDVNFYREQTVPILVNKMDDNRAKIYGEIIQQKDKSVDDYPMEAAIRDIVRYFNAGTLVRAFGELSKETAAKAKSSEDKILDLKDLKALDRIPTKEEFDVTESIKAQLDIIYKQIKSTSSKDLQEAGKKRLDVIYAFIVKDDTFKGPIGEFRADKDYKELVAKLDDPAKTALTATDLYDFIYEIYGNSTPEQKKKLQKIFEDTK